MNQFTLPKVTLYVTSLLVIIISAFLPKSYLQLAIPSVLFALIMVYSSNNKNINIYFILSLVAVMFSNYYTYVDIISHFPKICIFVSIYLAMACLSLKNYLSEIRLKWSKLISWSLVISLSLISYLIFSISELVLHKLPGSVPYILLAVISLLIYIAISYYIYVSDLYANGIKLLLAACLFIFVIAIAPINELYYPNRMFLVFENSAHILGLYVFMSFMKESNPAVSLSKVAKYV